MIMNTTGIAALVPVSAGVASPVRGISPRMA